MKDRVINDPAPKMQYVVRPKAASSAMRRASAAFRPDDPRHRTLGNAHGVRTEPLIKKAPSTPSTSSRIRSQEAPVDASRKEDLGTSITMLDIEPAEPQKAGFRVDEGCEMRTSVLQSLLPATVERILPAQAKGLSKKIEKQGSQNAHHPRHFRFTGAWKSPSSPVFKLTSAAHIVAQSSACCCDRIKPRVHVRQ